MNAKQWYQRRYMGNSAMARLRFSFSILFLVSFLREAKGGDDQNGIYIVYMGAASSVQGSLRSDHAHLLNSLHTRNAVVHSYRHGFSGFAARLTKEEAHSFANKPGVVSVFPDPLLQLHTTRSWDFLDYQNSIVIDGSAPPSDAKSTPQGSDTIIGILDTGIWPDSESFNDKGMGSIPTRWKGTCMTGQDFTSSNCNRNCDEGYVNGSQFKGKIVICENSDNDLDKRKVELVKKNGGIGVIIVHDMRRAVASNYASFPTTIISSKDAPQILNYINSTSDPVATILPTVVVQKYTPAPAVAYFSARGPTDRTRNLLKPDIVAPGANILAAWMGNDTQQALAGEAPPLFNLVSGTSMACPHVSAIVATIKSQNPTWSPSAIKSAIMTTATQMNNLKSPITTDSGSVATPYDFGAGLVSTTGPLQPGLVYETSTIDYLSFLCNYGYNLSTIKIISRAVPDGFACPKPKPVLLSDLNYPSIAISKFFGNKSRTIQRTVTNVAGDDQRVYTVSIKKPSGLNVTVTPTQLQFTKNNQQLTYEVLFSTSMESLPEDVFGSITWANGKYRVQIPFAVSSKGNYD